MDLGSGGDTENPASVSVSIMPQPKPTTFTFTSIFQRQALKTSKSFTRADRETPQLQLGLHTTAAPTPRSCVPLGSTFTNQV